MIGSRRAVTSSQSAFLHPCLPRHLRRTQFDPKAFGNIEIGGNPVVPKIPRLYENSYLSCWWHRHARAPPSTWLGAGSSARTGRGVQDGRNWRSAKPRATARATARPTATARTTVTPRAMEADRACPERSLRECPPHTGLRGASAESGKTTRSYRELLCTPVVMQACTGSFDCAQDDKDIRQDDKRFRDVITA
jgi:hypothetical protein